MKVLQEILTSTPFKQNVQKATFDLDKKVSLHPQMFGYSSSSKSLT